MEHTGESDLFLIERRYKFISNPHKIDDYDSTILEDRAYLNMEDKAFKLEYKIGMLEDNIAQISEEIEGAEMINDDIRLNVLRRKKLRMERQLRICLSEYSEIDIVSKIIGWVSFLVKRKFRKKTKIGNFVMKHILSKISKKMELIYSLKEALGKLSNINRSVDELIQMQAPVKDVKDRYERLTAYINKANSIHNEIVKSVNVKVKG